VLGSQDRCGVGAGVHFVSHDGCDEVGTLGKVAVNCADADAGLLGNLAHRSIHSRRCEHRLGCLKQRVEATLRVGPHTPIRAGPRRGALRWMPNGRILRTLFDVSYSTSAYPSFDHRFPLDNRNEAPYKNGLTFRFLPSYRRQAALTTTDR